jgi:phosphate-selective porin OprO/OprP
MHRAGLCVAVSLIAASFSNLASAQTGSSDSPATEPPRPGSEPAVRVESPPQTLEERTQELERRLRALEAKHVDAHGTATETKGLERSPDKGEAKGFERNPDKGVALAYGPDGVGIVSADGKFQFHFRPLVQADARIFLHDGTTTLLLRRARPALEGTAFEYFDWTLVPELTDSPSVVDAFINIRLFREIQLRGGRFNTPVGLERLTTAADLAFLERGLPTNLVPSRDIGVELHGDVLGGTLVYAGGIFNGAADGVVGGSDNNDKKDFAGRIMLRPLQPTFVTALRKLGLGVAATRGTHTGELSAYRTPVQTPFFQYVDGVTAGGTHRRIAPQASFYLGPFGLFGEYTRSTLIVAKAGQGAPRLNHEAWQVVASFFVTGEEASPTTVTPKKALNPRNFGTGAIELVARYGELRIDDDAFRLGFADPAQSARKATDWGVGINWHMARNFKWMIDFEHTSFVGGSETGDRRSEIVLLSRLQAAY